jgi:hypothetical protein
VLDGAPVDLRCPLAHQPVSPLAGQIAAHAVEVGVNDHLHGQLPLVVPGTVVEPAHKLLAPGFQLVDQHLLLLGGLD